MNEAIVLKMVEPYVKDSAITYDEFENIFSILSLREQYEVIETLYKNGIDLSDKQVDDEALILDVDEDESNAVFDDDFSVLYDESIFKDNGQPENNHQWLITNNTVKQSNEILCSLIKQGNRQAMQDLCVKNKRLVDKYVIAYEKRYGNRLAFEDLEQVGFIGLLKAAKKFSIEQGTAFSTYAVYWIKQSISREIMDNGYAIRIPVHMMERIQRVLAKYNQFEESSISFREKMQRVAEQLDISEDLVRECLILKKNYLSYSSLDVPIGEDGDTELGEIVPDETVESVEAIILRNSLRDELTAIMSELKPREREIIELRFGWNDGRVRTLEEIGNHFGVTRERIRQIETKALKKLRNPNRSKRIKDFLKE